jgi:ABC-type dipeptide/oligopeptide/nickel transport system permease subunit
MKKSWLIAGGIFGLVAPFIGMFFGLQVSTVLGNILAFPVIALVYITGTPFGFWGGGLYVLAITLSIVAWALIFGVASTLRKS